VKVAQRRCGSGFSRDGRRGKRGSGVRRLDGLNGPFRAPAPRHASARGMCRFGLARTTIAGRPEGLRRRGQRVPLCLIY